jgi:RHS repeat-associated protein
VDLVVFRDSLDINGHVQSGSRLYAEEDANGDVTSLVDNTQTGTVQERYEYDPYGMATYLDASWTSRSSSNFGWQMLHQGLRLDTLTASGKTTQLYYDRARDLIANEGRFAERDPLGLGGGNADLYGYVDSNPKSEMDPTGLWSFWRWLYTGDPNASDDAYAAAQEAAGASALANSDTAKSRLEKISYFDPTPISDSLGSGVSYMQGKDAEAAEELAWAVVPGALDKVGKLRKAGKAAETAAQLGIKNGDDVARAAKSGLAEAEGLKFHRTSSSKRSLGPKDPAATRPKLRKETKERSRAAAPKTPEGEFIDPNTGEVLSKDGPFDYGHAEGEEWWRTRDRAREEGWTREQVLEHENSKTFQIEDRSANRSHRYEKPKEE